MTNTRKTAVFGALLLLGAAGCADLDIDNPNDPDKELALATPGDIESLIAGTFAQWYVSSGGVTPADDGWATTFMGLNNQSFEYSAWPANNGAVFYSSFPRPPTPNDPAASFYGNFTNAWYINYGVLSSLAEGLAALDDPEVAEELGADGVLRARAYGKFMQGLAHGSLALLYDQAFVVDETTELADDAGTPIPQEPVAYTEMLNAALGYFEQAISLANQGGFTVPAAWTSIDVPAAELALIASSMKARYRAAVARTPEERAAVAWDLVLADIGNGVTESWNLDLDWANTDWFSYPIAMPHYPAWGQLSYFILGMADQSGKYQEWLSVPVAERLPNLPSGQAFLIETPDTRFAQGSTLDEQDANPGSQFAIPFYSLGVSWVRPDRGTYRWSYYRNTKWDSWAYNSSPSLVPEIAIEEMNLLAAEAHFRLGNTVAAAAIVNETRVAAGLIPTDAAGTNASCVPKLPDGSCGGLFEMLKWEKRLETQFIGLLGSPWYFEGRGWGDLYAGTQLQFPIPCREAQVLNLLPCNNFGGVGGASASPGSVYEFPHEP